MQIRNLIWNDVYAAAKIVKKIKIDITEEELERFGENVQVAGVNIIKNMIGNTPEAQEEINEFLGSLFGITGEEFGQLSFDEVFGCFDQFRNLKGIDSFFKSVGQLMKQK